MKIKFKHLIALTALLAIGQVSFGQGYPGVKYRDTNNNGVLDWSDTLTCESEWSLTHGTFTEEVIPQEPTTFYFEIKKNILLAIK